MFSIETDRMQYESDTKSIVQKKINKFLFNQFIQYNYDVGKLFLLAKTVSLSVHCNNY